MSTSEDNRHDTAHDTRGDLLTAAQPVEGDNNDEESEIQCMHAELMVTLEAIPETSETTTDLGAVTYSVRASVRINSPPTTPAQIEETSHNTYELRERVARQHETILALERENARLELEVEALEARKKAETEALQAKHDDRAEALAICARIFGEPDPLQSEEDALEDAWARPWDWNDLLAAKRALSRWEGA